MHVVQLILVDAETKEEAFSSVKSYLDDYSAGAWWDWNEAEYGLDSFAGRWAGGVFNINNSGVTQDYLCYGTDSALGDLVIEQFLETRQAEIDRLREKLLALAEDIPTYNPYQPIQTAESMNVWYVRKYTKLLMDDWSPESTLYDVSSGTASMKYALEIIRARPNNLWLIPVDFHF
jgi:hypothetical protein